MKWIGILLASAALAQTPPAPAPGAAASPAELLRGAMEKQRAAARKQAETVGARLLPWGPVPSLAEESCDPLPDTVLTPIIDRAAQANGVEAKLVRAVMEQESEFRPCAVSSKGAQGLMQLLPDTSVALAVKDPFDPQESVDAGARYLKQLLEKYKGDLKLVLSAYNAGPGAVDATGGVPDTAETRHYVEAILKKLQ